MYLYQYQKKTTTKKVMVFICVI